MISFFLERMRRKVRSLPGSRSLTVLRAFCVRLHNRPAYCTVVELSRVVRIGMPGNHTVETKLRDLSVENCIVKRKTLGKFTTGLYCITQDNSENEDMCRQHHKCKRPKGIKPGTWNTVPV